MKTYLNFLNQIKEGLIRTHNILKYESTLDILLNSIISDYEIQVIDKFRFDIKFKQLTKDSLDAVLNVINNFGYYPSYMWLSKQCIENNFKYDIEILENNLMDSFTIGFDSKYDDSLYKNDNIVPDTAYHLSPEKNKILKYGLIPKSKNRINTYSDRIYLFYDLTNYKNFLKNLKLNDVKNDIKKEYNLFEVSLKNLDIIIHTDPYFKKGFYIYDNIKPNRIELLKTKL